MKKDEIKIKSKRGIQPYVDYLLQDIQNAEGQEDDGLNPGKTEMTMQDHFMEMERLMFEDPVSSFGQICGLSTELFPPAEQLSKGQIKVIAKAFHHLLFTWNLGVEVPKKFPADKHYNLLVKLLDEKTHIIKDGFGYFDLCTCDPKTCPFEEYCSCKDLFDKEQDAGDKGNSGKSQSQSI